MKERTVEEILYPSSVPKETKPAAASSVEQSPAVRAFWDAIGRQTQREQAERSMADVLYPNQRKDGSN